jgi:hypothetical protein
VNLKSRQKNISPQIQELRKNLKILVWREKFGGGGGVRKILKFWMGQIFFGVVLRKILSPRGSASVNWFGVV